MINKNNFFLTSLIKNKKNKFVLIIKKFLAPIYFLKHIILIIILSLLCYLIAPKFFDYSKGSKNEIKIKNEMMKTYGIKLNNYSYILYKVLPRPRIIINGAYVNLGHGSTSGTIENFIFPLKFNQLYNYKFLKIEKVLLNNINFTVDVKYFKKFLTYLKNLNHEITIQTGKLKFKEQNNELLTIDVLEFNNKNNLNFKGVLLDKKINISFSNKKGKNKLILDIPSAGSKSVVSFASNSTFDNLKGNVRSTILNNNIQFNFEKNKHIKITNSSFINKLLSTSFDGLITIKPYFNFDLLFNVKYINLITDQINNSFLNTVKNLNINSKSNGKFRIVYKNKKLNYKFINQSDIKVSFKNRDIIFKDSFLEFDGGNVIFSAIISEYEGYKNLNFKLISNLKDTNLLLGKLDLPKNKDNKLTVLEVEGTLNLSSRKINFDNIYINKILKSKKDIKYIKIFFEKQLIEKNIIGIFDKKNIKNFIKEFY